MCVCSRKRMIVFEVRTCVCALGEHLWLLTCAHMCARCSWTHICVPVVYICVPHVPRVHARASELDTPFIVFQVNTCVFHVSTLARRR